MITHTASISREEVKNVLEEYNEYNWAPSKKIILDELQLTQTPHNMKVLSIVLADMKKDGEIISTYTMNDEGKFGGRGYVLKECL